MSSTFSGNPCRAVSCRFRVREPRRMSAWREVRNTVTCLQKLLGSAHHLERFRHQDVSPEVCGVTDCFQNIYKKPYRFPSSSELSRQITSSPQKITKNQAINTKPASVQAATVQQKSEQYQHQDQARDTNAKMINMMRVAFPTRTWIIHTDTHKKQYKGQVLAYDRAKGQDFFIYTISVVAENAQAE